MKKHREWDSHVWLFRKLLRIMKLTSFLILLFVVSVSASTYSQATKLSLKVTDGSFSEVLKQIENQSEFYFYYNNDEISSIKSVSIDVTNKNIQEILDELLTGSNLGYKIIDRYIVVAKKNEFTTSEVVQQQKTVSGKVTDLTGVPIPGVSVLVKGTTTGVITDNNGIYSLANIPENAILQFSFVGMKTKEFASAGKTSFNIIMEDEIVGLEEVVAIGYGTQKKKLVTGATIQVKGADIQKLNTISPLTALQSQSTGVSITSVSGKPGEGYKVNIRGIGTIGNSDPLIIIDDIVGGDLNSINPNDIESIDVLKDAASASIYGSRAANGVILVKTKSGKVGKPVITYDGYYGVQNVAKYPELANAQQYLELVNEAYKNSNIKPPVWEDKIPNWSKIQDGWAGTNWVKEFAVKNAPQQNHSLNITGGTDMTKYAVGFSYTNQKGIFGQPSTPEYTRYSFRSNTDFVLLKNSSFDVIKVGQNLLYNYTERLHGDLPTQGIWANTIHNLELTNPLMSVYDEAGNFAPSDLWSQQTNPIGYNYYNFSMNERLNHSLSSNFYLEIQPIRNLKFKSSFGYKYNSYSGRSFVPVYDLGGKSFNQQNRVNQDLGVGMEYQIQNTLNYIKQIAENHNFDLLIGQSFEKQGMGVNMSGSNREMIFNDFEHAYLSNAKTIVPGNISLDGAPYGIHAISSFFGRLNYDYKETYMATLILRQDASSNFAPGHRWGTFPSVSAGWLVTNESFMSEVTNITDYLKIRASWGQNGNESINPFQYNAIIAFNDADYPFGADKTKVTTGAYPSIIPNKDVTWETSEQFDVGIDARFLNSRIGLNIDYYDKRTKGWLVQAPVLASWGAGAPYVNGGDIRNHGFEMSLTYHDKIGAVNYSISANASFNKNEVTRIANTDSIIWGSNEFANGMESVYRAKVGEPIGYFYGMQTNGIFKDQDAIDNYQGTKLPDAKPGDFIWVDNNNDGTIDLTDRTNIGSPHPKMIYGLSFSMDWKGLDFSVTTNGRMGNKVAAAMHQPDRFQYNYPVDMLDRWQSPDQPGKYPRLEAGKSNNYLWFSPMYLFDGSFYRIQNITLGYDFKKLMPQMFLGQARIYISAQNLYTFTSYPGMDPEVGYGEDNWGRGIDTGFYPNPRTFLVGLNLKF